MSSVTNISGSSYFDLVSGSIKFTGLGSGTDFDEVVDQLVEIESIQMNRMELWKTEWEAKIEAIQGLNQRLSAVDEAAAAIDEEGEFLVRQGTSSDSTVATATGSSSAATGAYTLEVGSDVKHILQSGGVATDGPRPSAGRAVRFPSA